MPKEVFFFFVIELTNIFRIVFVSDLSERRREKRLSFHSQEAVGENRKKRTCAIKKEGRERESWESGVSE